MDDIDASDEFLASNRIINAVAAMTEQIDGRIAAGLVTAEKVAAHSKSLDLDFAEFATFQEVKSLAAASGVLTPDEANTVYGYLGNTPDHFNRQEVAVKYVLSGVFRELLERRMERKVIKATVIHEKG